MRRLGLIPVGTPPRTHVVDLWRADVLVRGLPALGWHVEYYDSSHGYDAIIAFWVRGRESLILDVTRRHPKAALVVETTDALLTYPWRRYSLAGKLYLGSRYLARERWEILAFLRRIPWLVVGSEGQRDMFQPYVQNVRILPDTILDPHAAATHRDTTPCRIAWIGRAVSLTGLAMIQPVLDALADRQGYELHIIAEASELSRRSMRWPQSVAAFLERQRIPWTWTRIPDGSNITEFAPELAQCTIGIVPVEATNTYFSTKTPGRPLLLMSFGLPVVVSDIPAHRAIICHAQTGYLADTTESWVTAITTLAASCTLRANIGSAARALALTQYGEQAFVEQYGRILGEALHVPAVVTATSSSSPL